MAILHANKDIPTAAATQITRLTLGRAELAVLFVNLWSVWLGVPYLKARELSAWDAAFGVLPSVTFGLGLWSQRQSATGTMTAHRTPSSYLRDFILQNRKDLLLLVATPLALAIALVVLRQRSAALPLGPIALLLCTLALWAYGAVCLMVDRPAEGRLEITISPLPPVDLHRPSRMRVRLLAAFFCLGALCVGVIAPAMTPHARGKEEMAWTLLTTTIAAGLAIAIAGLWLGRALRPTIPKPPAALWPLVVLSAAGIVVYLLILRQ